MKTINGITVKRMKTPPKRRNWAEIFSQMEIGDGFEATEKDIASVRASGSAYKRTHPEWSYSSLKIEENKYNVVRIERKMR